MKLNDGEYPKPLQRMITTLLFLQSHSHNDLSTLFYTSTAMAASVVVGKCVRSYHWRQLGIVARRPEKLPGTTICGKEQWLLEENQHLSVPPTHLDDHTSRVFSMGNFVERADEAREMDVQKCALSEMESTGYFLESLKVLLFPQD
jgi:hypothetical protein